MDSAGDKQSLTNNKYYVVSARPATCQENPMRIDPDTSLGFLVSDIARMLREQFNETAQKVGLTQAQARALLQLGRNEGISQVALAQLLEIQPITLLRNIDRLEQAGLVERKQNPADRRAQQLYLTPAAQPLLEEIADLGKSLSDAALKGIDSKTRNTLISTLQQVKANLTRPPAVATISKPGVRG
jgi:DNA-binding MarR family transcriptional regulator